MEKRKIKLSIIFLILIIFIVIISFIFSFIFFKSANSPIDNENFSSDSENVLFTVNALVVKVNENSLDVLEIVNGSTDSYLSVTYSEEGNTKFKQGQEVLIYSNGGILESFPGQVYGVEKVEIKKEKSDIPIPKETLQFYYNSFENISVTITNFTKTGLSLRITDTNELPYEYFNTYYINKKNIIVEDSATDSSPVTDSANNSKNFIAGHIRLCNAFMGRST